MRGIPVPSLLCMLVVLAVGAVEAVAQSITITPVGKIHNTSDRCFIEIYPQYRAALLGLDGFSHVIVFYWFDRNDIPQKRAKLQVHPRADPSNPLRGVFATRSPVRPNLIGFNVCRIMSIQDGTVTIDKSDAFDGTPVIDIKPYIPSNDCVPDARVPIWVDRKR